MGETILVDVECIQSTAADIDHFQEGRQYTVDMRWAKNRGIWRYFRPLREIPESEAEERLHDEVIPEQQRREKERAEANEEAEAKLKEKPKAEKKG